MKNNILLILTYLLVIAALAASVKLLHTYIARNQPVHDVKIADCGDPPPTPSPGE